MSVGHESERDFAAARDRMVERQLRARGVRNERVLAAMARVPRHEFVPAAARSRAYDDGAIAIGFGQTISQPYMVAIMTEAIDPAPDHRVLEVGTGSGYQAAVLAHLVADVTTVEWVPELGEAARERLERLGLNNVHVRIGDGTQLAEDETFDGIVVTAGGPAVPPVLLGHLAEGGCLVMPTGARGYQTLTVVRRTADGVEEEAREGCVFVPLRGAYGWTGEIG